MSLLLLLSSAGPAAYTLSCSGGSLSLVGNDVSFQRTFVLSCTSSSFAVTGIDATPYKSITAPTDIPQSIKGWFDASNESSLTVSSNNLTVWNDLSGQNDHLDTIQGNNPKSRTRTISGKNAIEFNNDGAIYDFDNTGGTSAPQATIGMVFVADANSGTIVSSRTTLDSKISIDGTSKLVMYGNSSNSQTSTRTITTSQIYTVVGVFDGTNSKLWIDGVSENMSSIIEDRILVAMIGAAGAGSTDYFDGLVGEVAIYDNALTDSQVLSLHSYLYKKWVLSKTVLADQASYSLSGGTANFILNRKITAERQTYSLNGIAANLTYTPITGYNLTAASGSFALSFSSTGLTASRKLAADIRTYTFNGIAANTLYGRKLTADTRTYTFNGIGANTLYARKLTADIRTYTFNGIAANTIYARKLTADTQTYTFNGITANTLYGRKLIAQEFRANYIRNSMMGGTASGTPGTAPTLWATAQAAWATRTIVGTGVDPTTGLTYIDIAYSGTNNTGSISSLIFDPISTTLQPAIIGETWTSSAYFGLVSGAWPSNANIITVARNSASVGVGNSTVSIKSISSSVLQKFTATFTASNINTAYIQTAIRFDASASETVNFTVRIAAPQLERGSIATAFIPTTNAIQYRWFETSLQNANLLKGNTLGATQQTYTFSGIAANTLYARKLIADIRTYTFNGIGAGLIYTPVGAYVLVAQTYPLSITTPAVSLLTSKKLTADIRTYTFNGIAANTLYGRKLTADIRTYTFNGIAANTLRGRKLTADIRTYTFNGIAANTIYARKLTADIRTYTFNGIAANTLYGRKLTADIRTYTLTRNPANLYYGRIILATQRTYSLTEVLTNLRVSRKLTASTQSYTLVPYNVQLVKSLGYIKVWTGSTWAQKPVKVWTGSAWTQKPLKRWDGTTWKY